MRLVILCMLLTLISNAHAFPLHGSNGVVNATVYGIITELNPTAQDLDRIYVDMSLSRVDGMYEATLIDSEDQMYPGKFGAGQVKSFEGRKSEGGSYPIYNYSTRCMVSFDVPRDVAIKRIRISPTVYVGGGNGIPDGSSDPFSIDWTGVPEVSDKNAILRFYGATKVFNDPQNNGDTWAFDIKITNNAPETIGYEFRDFAMVDQFGWVYPSDWDGLTSGKILSNESLRFTVEIPNVTKISRPIALKYKDLVIDISAWV
jgi:hypothetical protein